MIPIADAHCDRPMHAGRNADITAHSLQKGGVALQTFALFSGPRGPAGDPYTVVRRGLANFFAFLGDTQKGPWQVRQTRKAFLPEDHTAAMLSIEGGECLQGSLSRLHEFAALGVRMLALTWNHENEIGHPSAKEGEGLKPFGKELLREMERLHIAADTSHLSEKGFWDVERACGPFMATHSNAKALCGHHRNLTDEQIRAIIRHEGFIGINFYPLFLNGSERDGGAGIADIVRHIDHIAQMGGAEALGFGSDFDGIDTHPAGVPDPSGFPAILNALRERGYGEEALRDIAGRNLVRFLGKV